MRSAMKTSSLYPKFTWLMWGASAIVRFMGPASIANSLFLAGIIGLYLANRSSVPSHRRWYDAGALVLTAAVFFSMVQWSMRAIG